MKNITKIIFSLIVITVLVSGCKSQAKPAETIDTDTIAPTNTIKSTNTVSTISTIDIGSIRDIFAGVSDLFILQDDNTLWGAGYHRSDRFGFSDTSGDLRIARINDETGNPFFGVKYVAAGEKHAVILKEDGTIWGAGDSSFGELGFGGGNLMAFTELGSGKSPIGGVKTIAAGNNSTLYIDSDGSLWVSGFNYYGELGLGSRDQQSSFKQAESAGKNIKTVTAGIRHTALLKEDGALWAAGYNFNGQLGLGDTEDRNDFTEVKNAGAGIKAVATGNYHTVILKSDGSVWTAGSNYWGQLGLPGIYDQPNLTRVSDENGSELRSVKEIAARGNLTVLVKADGSLLLAGNYTDTEGTAEFGSEAGAAIDSTKQAGGSGFAALVPERGTLIKFAGVKKLVLGNNSVYVIDTDNRLWAAGSNRYGQLKLDLKTVTTPVLTLIN